MDMKSIVSSLEKLHSGSDPYDVIMIKYLVDLLMYLEDLLYFMCVTKYILISYEVH